MYKVILMFLTLAYPFTSMAHSRWIVPSHTLVSGNKPIVIALDMSISNDIFHADNPYGGIPIYLITQPTKNKVTELKEEAHPLVKIAASTHVIAYQPDGSQISTTNIINLGRKSATTIQLEQNGTYRIQVIQNPIFYTTYKMATGEPGKVFGIDNKVKLPESAVDIQRVKLINRVETYVTRNQSSISQPIGNGLEIIFSGHPNDLFVNEKTEMTLLFNGKPIKNTNISITPANTRYRNNRAVQQKKTGNNGKLEIIWQKAGLYLLESKFKLKAKHKQTYDKEIHTIYLTLEVFPE